MLTDLSVKEFLEKVASGEPVPGGGSVAALAAALSASLSAMVARLTLGKTKGDPLDEKMAELIGRASSLCAKLIDDVDRDSRAYTAVMDAYRMPKGSKEEEAVRVAAIQDALKEAASVPLSVSEAGFALMKLARDAVKEGKKSAVTDALVAGLMARSAVMGALSNVRINLTSIKDKAFRDTMSEKAVSLEEGATALEKEIIALAGSIMKAEA